MNESNSGDGAAASIREALVRVAEVVGGLVEREPELRSALAALGDAWRRSLEDEAGEGSAEELEEANPGETEAPSSEKAEEAVERVTRAELEGLVDAFSGRRAEPSPAQPATSAIGGGGPSSPPVSPRIMAERCRLKQRACVLATELDERLEGGQVVVPHEDFQPLVNQAKALPDCYLWMLRPETRGWIDAEDWELLGRAFDNLARALVLADALVEDEERDEEGVREALSLAAEAQRAVRQAVVPCVPPGRNFEDSDQLAAYRWVAHQCDVLRVYVARHMRVDDPADPRDWADLKARIADFENRRSARTEGVRARNKHFGKIRYEAQRLLEATPAELEQRVEKIAAAADELIASGVKPSDVRLRELLLPVFDLLEETKESSREGFQLVMREMDRFLASREPSSAETAVEAEDSASPEVARVREWLRGRELVVVGGEERPVVVERLKSAFDLAALTWVATRPHESTEVFRAPIQRPEVAAVLLAIRWSSHSYGGIRDYCEAVGKPLVRLPGGYGTNRVAHEIVEQASEALEQG